MPGAPHRWRTLALALASLAFALSTGCRRNPEEGSSPTSAAPGLALPAAGTLTSLTAPRVTDDQPPARPLPDVIHAVWVARFHYRSPDDIREVLHNCAALGFNTVLWQVRGDATVAFPSQLEPWSTEYDHRDPGFDPLELAVAEAHRLNLRIEAWVNVMPGWFGKKPPAINTHLFHARPDWFLFDDAGRRQPLNEHYVILNPCLPAVRDHIVGVLEEIATRYAVDGLHLDYVRYAWDKTPDAARRFPRDAQTVDLFRRQAGAAPDDDPAAWRSWRANQLTRLVGGIRDMLGRVRPTAALTAAVWGDPVDGYQSFLQDAAGWLAAGLLDAAYPMAYRRDLAAFERCIAQYRTAAPGQRVVPGIGAYLLDKPDGLRQQLASCRAWGGDLAIFSYESLYDVFSERGKAKPDPRRKAVRLARRDALAEFLSAPAGMFAADASQQAPPAP